MSRFLARTLPAILVAFAASTAQAEWRRAGPVWHGGDAQDKCPRVCGREAWDGNWRRNGPGFEADCNCLPRGWQGGYGQRGGSDRPRPGRTVQINAGPIWHNGDAQDKCPRVCGNVGRWNGQWTTVGPGASVCGCVVTR